MLKEEKIAELANFFMDMGWIETAKGVVFLFDHSDIVSEKEVDRAYQKMLEEKKKIKKAEAEYFASIS